MRTTTLWATYCPTLLSATGPRWADRVDVEMKAMGPVLVIDEIESQVVEMDLPGARH
ncbi:MAG: hypothetical protein ACK4IU_16095 [Tabrizicola flagellatus]|uniref:hypothetical protein n=1 Tax=Tabrizicola flagellatus TaxID=2593021 RepID=UPI0039187A23